jgi:hypothetical protein
VREREREREIWSKKKKKETKQKLIETYIHQPLSTIPEQQQHGQR